MATRGRSIRARTEDGSRRTAWRRLARWRRGPATLVGVGCLLGLTGCTSGGGTSPVDGATTIDGAAADGGARDGPPPIDGPPGGADAASEEYGPAAWHACGGEERPDRALLLPLPGGGQGPPVVTSNNPEAFTGDGLLFGTARASPARGGASFPLDDFGIYLHHVNGTEEARYLQVVVTNPNDAPVTVEAWGSAISQDETGGLPLGGSPDYLVSEDWIGATYRTEIAATAVAPFTPLRVWYGAAGANREIDGRFHVHASGPVYAYVVATTGTDVNEAITDGLTDAPGIIAVPGAPPPPFGREAGVYAHDTWRAEIRAVVPAGPRRIAWWIDTATGVGAADVQAFPALTHYDDSAAEATGMYGNVYDLTLRLRHDGADAGVRSVTIALASYAQGAPSRYWDGAARVDGEPVTVRCTPESPVSILAVRELGPGQQREVHIRAMVPGLTSIPEALLVSTGCP